MKIFIITLFLAAAVLAAAAATTTTSQAESAQQSIRTTQSDATIHSMADNSLRTQSDRWLGPLIGLKTFTEDVGARVTLRPRLKARNEGALGQAPWYGMAFGLACTTLAALMLG